jgi:glyoxylase I family protein
MLVGIHHTALSTPDAGRLVAFYRDQFGFAVEFDFPWDEDNAEFRRTHAAPETKGRVVMLARGASRLEIFEYQKPVPRPMDGPRPNADHGVAHFCFEVKEIEQEYRRLRDAGVPFLSEPVQQAYVKVCYGRDPDGNLFELLELLGA